MSFPLPDSEFRTDEPAPKSPWRITDLIVFAVFSLLTVLFLPITALRVWHIFNPELRVADLTAVDQVILQGLMNSVLVGFIVFLIKVVTRQSFVEWFHWFGNLQFILGFLFSLVATLSFIVL